MAVDENKEQIQGREALPQGSEKKVQESPATPVDDDTSHLSNRRYARQSQNPDEAGLRGK